MNPQQKMGMEHQEQKEKVPQLEQKKPSKSLRSKAAHFVSDLTTVLLNPISDKPFTTPQLPSSQDNLNNTEHSQSDSEEASVDSLNGPDTTSFTAFLYSLLGSSESETISNFDRKSTSHENEFKTSTELITKEYTKNKSFFSRGKQSIGKAFSQADKIGRFQNRVPKGGSSEVISNRSTNSMDSNDEGISMQTLKEALPLENLPETSEPSVLLSEKNRSVLYTLLPVIVQGRKWILLYSTWRHGISLSTLYRRSLLWPGLSLLVVGERSGAIFGGLVEAPLRPTNKRRYQGTNNSFVFTNVSGKPDIFRPTGINRYFTLCSTEYLAFGGGNHFALYLDGDLLNGSSSSSETYGNPCLSRAEDFQVNEIELWGFIYASKYEEILASLQTEAPGICHW